MENAKAKILLIDDDPDFKEAVTRILQSAYYEVVTAANVTEGREKILGEKPDLILLDIMMDSLFDGFSLCHAVKTEKAFAAVKDTPIIHVSAVKEKTGARFQFQGGDEGLKCPDDYLDKPVKAEELISRIEALLNK